MPNPLVNQGTLNRIRPSVVVSSLPTLNITAPYMGKGMVSISKDTAATDYLPTATGNVPSPEPYQVATVSVNIMKTNGLAQKWENQVLDTVIIGDITCYTDSAPYGPFKLLNCVIDNIQPGAFSGTEPTVMLTLKGTYNINDALWNL